MRICIMCNSTLLQKSLEYYLGEFLCDFAECDFIIADMYIDVPKPVCVIDSTPQANIFKPFTPISLFRGIQEFYHTRIKNPNANPLSLLPKELLNIKDPKLQSKIDSILQEFSTKIYQTLNNPSNKNN